MTIYFKDSIFASMLNKSMGDKDFKDLWKDLHLNYPKPDPLISQKIDSAVSPAMQGMQADQKSAASTSPHVNDVQNTAMKDKEFAIVKCNPFAGMFSMFSVIASTLYSYEKGEYQGVKVDFSREGLYYDPNQGSNWWEYYCEPISEGKKPSTDHTFRNFVNKDFVFHGCRTEKLPRKEIHEIVKKYIKVKSHITKKVDEFVDKYFKNNFIVGLHYRGTDKDAEAPRTSYESAAKAIHEQLEQNKQGKDYKIFVATDEEPFMNYMMKEFPGKIIASNAKRSSDGKPLHITTSHPYEQGEEALVDCLLLSKCSTLIRTNSNLSLWSTYFNPDIPVIEISQRYKPGEIRKPWIWYNVILNR